MNVLSPRIYKKTRNPHETKGFFWALRQKRFLCMEIHKHEFIMNLFPITLYLHNDSLLPTLQETRTDVANREWRGNKNGNRIIFLISSTLTLPVTVIRIWNECESKRRNEVNMGTYAYELRWWRKDKRVVVVIVHVVLRSSASIPRIESTLRDLFIPCMPAAAGKWC